MRLQAPAKSGRNDILGERRRLKNIIERLTAIEGELEQIAEHKKELSERAKALNERRRGLLEEATNPQLCLDFDAYVPQSDAELLARIVHEVADEVEAELPRSGRRKAPQHVEVPQAKPKRAARGIDPSKVQWTEPEAEEDAPR